MPRAAAAAGYRATAGPAVADRRGLRRREKPLVPFRLGLLAGRGGDLLQYAGHREQDRWPEGGQLRGRLTGVGKIGGAVAGVHQAQGNDPGQDVDSGRKNRLEASPASTRSWTPGTLMTARTAAVRLP